MVTITKRPFQETERAVLEVLKGRFTKPVVPSQLLLVLLHVFLHAFLAEVSQIGVNTLAIRRLNPVIPQNEVSQVSHEK